MSKINKLFFTFPLLFAFFFINSCDQGLVGSNEEYLSVVSTNPKNSQINISRDTEIVIVLDKSFENIKQSTITNSNLTILDSNGSTVTGNINMVGNNLIFKSLQRLKANEKYTVKLSKNIKDLDGNTLRQDYTYSFTTKKQTQENSQVIITNESSDSTSKDIEDIQIYKSHIYTLSDSEILKISINDETDITRIPLSGTAGAKGFAISSNGDIFIANTMNNKITKLLASNNYALDTSLAISDAGHRVGELYHPYDVSVSGEGEDLEVFVLDSGNNRVQIFDYVGIYLDSFDGSSSIDGKLNNPLNIIGSNTMIITDSGNNMLRAMSYNQRTQKLDSKKILSLESFGKVTYSSNGILLPDNTNKQLIFMYLHGEQIKTIPNTQDIHIAIAYNQNNKITQVTKSPREITHKTIPKTPIELAPTALTKKFIKAYLDEDDESMLKIAPLSLIEKLKTIRDKVVVYFKFIEKYRESIYFYGMKAVVFGLVISPEHNVTESTNVYLKFDFNWVGDKWVLIRVF